MVFLSSLPYQELKGALAATSALEEDPCSCVACCSHLLTPHLIHLTQEVGRRVVGYDGGRLHISSLCTLPHTLWVQVWQTVPALHSQHLTSHVPLAWVGRDQNHSDSVVYGVHYGFSTHTGIIRKGQGAETPWSNPLPMGDRSCRTVACPSHLSNRRLALRLASQGSSGPHIRWPHPGWQPALQCTLILSLLPPVFHPPLFTSALCAHVTNEPPSQAFVSGLPRGHPVLMWPIAVGFRVPSVQQRSTQTDWECERHSAMTVCEVWDIVCVWLCVFVYICMCVCAHMCVWVGREDAPVLLCHRHLLVISPFASVEA